MDCAVGEIVDWLSTGAPFPYPASGAARALEVIVAFHVSHALVDVPLPRRARRRRRRRRLLTVGEGGPAVRGVAPSPGERRA